MNFNITRRQFLQYCAASAAALGLSQTDLLKLEKALATPQTGCTAPSPSVIWLSGQACSGCPVSLLNRMVMTGGKYYDADMLNALYGAGLATPTSLDVAGADPANHDSPWVNPLAVVNDVADLLVGDAVRALVPGLTRSLLWADDAAAAVGLGLLPSNTLLGAYLAPFPTGYVTLEWNATVMAAAGDIPVDHLNDIVNNHLGLLGVYILMVDGAVPTLDEGYCMVFDDPNNYSGFKGVGTPAANPDSVTMASALRWMAPGAAAIISVGTCASYGGIPAATGNKTGAMGVKEFLAGEGITTPVINVPGCPPHPDWIVYPAAYVLSHSTFPPLSLALPTLDIHGRPTAVYTGTGGDNIPFCFDCANQPTQGTPQAAQRLGDAGCVGALGCKGPYTLGDCPIRQKNTADDGTLMNWCVGAQGLGAPSGHVANGIGSARHPCQGCIMPDFPDWTSLCGEAPKTSPKIKGFYNG